MSIRRSVSLLPYASIEPLVPAGTMAVLAVMAPVRAFRVETVGWAVPVGHALRYPKLTLGRTVKFNE